MSSAADVVKMIRSRRPGDSLPVVFRRRSGETITAMLRLIADPRQELLPVEQTGQALTDAQRRFRHAWLSSARTPF